MSSESSEPFGSAASASWYIDLFGVLQVRSLHEPNAPPSQRFRTQATGSLLAYLAYYKGQPQPREVLLEQFWPDVDVKLSRGRLSVALSSLRAQFPSPPGAPELLRADNFAITLNPTLVQTDVAAFRDTLRRARRTRFHLERQALLEETVRLYNGDLLSGRYDVWIVAEQERLREQFDQAQAELESLRRTDGTPDKSRPPIIVQPALGTLPIATPSSLSGTYTVVMIQGEPSALDVARSTLQSYPAHELIVGRIDDSVGSKARQEIEVGCWAFSSALTGLRYALAVTNAVTNAVETAASTATQAAPRIAVDTGFLDEQGLTSDWGTFSAPLLRSLAHLVDVAYEGQILCTESPASLARSPSTVSSATETRRALSALRFRDLGPIRLEAEDSPRRLFQVEDAAAPPRFFAPLRVPMGYAPLPTAATRFFGREKEMAQLTAMLGLKSTEANTLGKMQNATQPSSGQVSGQGAFVSLIGLGGIGKTRLSLETAAAVSGAFGGRVWFVPLSEVQEAERIPDAIRDALRLPKDPLLDPMEQCVTFLSSTPSRPALLVIDNAEPFLTPPKAGSEIHSTFPRCR